MSPRPSSVSITPLLSVALIWLISARVTGCSYGTIGSTLELLEHRQIRRGVIDAERSAVLRLRELGEINDDAWRRIERDLDLEELRMEA